MTADLFVQIYRDIFTERTSTGFLLVDHEAFCDSLEDRIRAPGVKVRGATCVDAGEYDLLYTYSNRFKRKLPLIAGVPRFEGVRIHWGNNEFDTEGCPCVGTARQTDRVLNSARAFNELDKILAPHFAAGGKARIQIVNINPPNELLRESI